MAMQNSTRSPRERHKRILLWSFIIIIAGALTLPLTGYVYVKVTSAQTKLDNKTNPRANYWRAVRDGVPGYSAVKGQERGILIENGGQNWRQIRNGPIAGLTPWVLGLVLLAIMAFYLYRGPVRLKETPSGVTVKRWSLWERTLHWYTATLFILLAITGLSLLFGRALLIPLLGLEGFSTYAGFAMVVHNYLGPLFAVGIFLEMMIWMKYNLPNRVDWEWFKKMGGLVGDEHPSAGRMNGGEKVWFWLIATVGVAVIVTGFILDFPNFGQTRSTMQSAHVTHVISAVIWLSAALGHIYIGSLGTEGALEGMVKGQVSAEWAKQHHDLWYEEVKGQQGQEQEKPIPGTSSDVNLT
ncbi:formate dehydrogenase, gamma subunit [Nitrosococcus halophilus Nc 4]|uniref:Formate dehydrogenase, gamma subunit n=1 Tax=Nitrosococcus halophilus (strain Nc4) TaxID=472759 RepID=D5C1W6_NITHN|nr:formate dehydrogenase subunit gamma [Nitrosococcus halophilus]ADE14749.1 formate dehydrogenase, gamma subunit [Nitrosococcus halophilus Nc 4]